MEIKTKPLREIQRVMICLQIYYRIDHYDIFDPCSRLRLMETDLVVVVKLIRPQLRHHKHLNAAFDLFFVIVVKILMYRVQVSSVCPGTHLLSVVKQPAGLYSQGSCYPLFSALTAWHSGFLAFRYIPWSAINNIASFCLKQRNIARLKYLCFSSPFPCHVL